MNLNSRETFIEGGLVITITFVFSLQIFSQSTVKCVIKTSLGDIQLELYPEKAPITVSNFLKYVDGNLYKNSSFFRVCTPENEAKRVWAELEFFHDRIANLQGMPTEEETLCRDGKVREKHGIIKMKVNEIEKIDPLQVRLDPIKDNSYFDDNPAHSLILGITLENKESIRIELSNESVSKWGIRGW